MRIEPTNPSRLQEDAYAGPQNKNLQKLPTDYKLIY